MEGEILRIELVHHWLYDILIPLGSSIITGVIVGLVVGYTLRKRQKENRLEEQRRREVIDIIAALTGHLYDLHIRFYEYSNLLIISLKEGNKKVFARTFGLLVDVPLDINRFVLVNDVSIENSIVKNVTMLTSEILHFTDTLKELFHKIPERFQPGFLDEVNKHIGTSEKERITLIESILELISDVKKHRCSL